MYLEILQRIPVLRDTAFAPCQVFGSEIDVAIAVGVEVNVEDLIPVGEIGSDEVVDVADDDDHFELVGVDVEVTFRHHRQGGN